MNAALTNVGCYSQKESNCSNVIANALKLLNGTPNFFYQRSSYALCEIPDGSRPPVPKVLGLELC